MGILRTDHVSQDHNTTRFAEPLAILTRLRVLVLIDDLAHFRDGAFAFLLVLLVRFDLLDGQGVDDAAAIGSKTLSLFVSPLGHKTGSKILGVRPESKFTFRGGKQCLA